MIIKPIDFYIKQLRTCTEELQKIRRSSLLLSLARLVVFGLTVFGIYFLSNYGNISIAIGIVGAVLFFLLLNKYVSVKNQLEFLKKKSELLKHEIAFLEDGIKPFDDGSEFIDHSHSFSSDVDLFGPDSLFQYLNRTKINESKSLLAQIISSNHIHEIKEKQSVLEELSKKAEWRLNFTSQAALVTQNIGHEIVFNWLKSYQTIIPKLISVLAIVFPIISIGLIALYVFDIINYLPLVIVFFMGLLISSFFIKRINKASVHLSELKSVFSHYGNLIHQIEQNSFTSKGCVEFKDKLITDNKLASDHVKQFSQYLNALDQRHNILFAVLGNGFLLWDCRQVNKVENWIEIHKNSVQDWFKAIVWFDTQNSLANFHFNHPEFVFPEINKDASKIIEAKNLGHFFIDQDKRVANDFSIDKQSFSIITGANMAGKSTFLRTVAFSIISANAGLPICATSFRYSPIKLITSMRNTDSLKDDSSYFFAELSRLKIIVDAVSVEPYFVILDEILKGTNSKDKEEGSIKLMRKISKTKASGLIATHDLGLCEIEKEIPSMHNQYFDAEIVDDELYFDYTLKEGVCQNMNASFLLKKMEIV